MGGGVCEQLAIFKRLSGSVLGFRILGSVEFRPDRLGWAEGAGGSGIKRLGEQNACEDRPLGFSV